MPWKMRIPVIPKNATSNGQVGLKTMETMEKCKDALGRFVDFVDVFFIIGWRL